MGEWQDGGARFVGDRFVNPNLQNSTPTMDVSVSAKRTRKFKKKKKKETLI